MEVLSGILGFFCRAAPHCPGLDGDQHGQKHLSAAALAFGVNLFVWLMSLMTSSAAMPAVLTWASLFSLYERLFLSPPHSSARNILFYLMFCISMLAVSSR